MPGTDTKKSKRERPVDKNAETEDQEYKSGGLPKTSKYSVDQNAKTQPSVSTPKDMKEKNARPADTNYGF